MSEQNGKMPKPVLSLREFVSNFTTLSRMAMANKMIDPEGRDIDKECGYPRAITPQMYKALYDREGIAARVVGVYPDECWSVYPELYEDETSDKTPFEEKWDELLFHRNCWHYLHRIDEISGIGRFGLLMLGINDQQTLDKPLKGIESDGTFTEGYEPTDIELQYMRTFDETQVDVVQVETDVTNPRYGMPNMYLIKFTAPQMVSFGQENSDFKTVQVHWTRCLHVADNRRSSEVYGIPRLQDCWNRVVDIRKTLGGSAEMFWKGAFPGFSFETLPEIAAQADIDPESIKEQFDLYQNGLQRYLALSGMSAKQLAPQVASPKDHIEQHLQAICITKGVPMRVFMGTEAGHLASTQDVGTWNKRVRRRQFMYLNPLVIYRFINRLMAIGVLPKVKKYGVDWTDLNSLTEMDRADIAVKITQALATYVGSGVEQALPMQEYYQDVLGKSVEKATNWVKAAETRQEEMQQEQMDEQSMMIDQGLAPDPTDPQQMGFGGDQGDGGDSFEEDQTPALSQGRPKKNAAPGGAAKKPPFTKNQKWSKVARDLANSA